jgi:hypothetical protein
MKQPRTSKKEFSLRHKEDPLPAGRASWLRRSVGLAHARHLLRRCLALRGEQGRAALATAIRGPKAAGDGAAAGVPADAAPAVELKG